jgi:hypothetical protein
LANAADFSNDPEDDGEGERCAPPPLASDVQVVNPAINEKITTVGIVRIRHLGTCNHQRATRIRTGTCRRGNLASRTRPRERNPNMPTPTVRRERATPSDDHAA